MKTKLFLLSLLWLIATETGELTYDTELRLRMTHSWCSDEPEVPPTPDKPTSREEIRFGVEGVDGKRYFFATPASRC